MEGLQKYVDEGDVVKKGQALAKIDDGGLYNELKLVESQAKLAKLFMKDNQSYGMIKLDLKSNI